MKERGEAGAKVLDEHTYASCVGRRWIALCIFFLGEMFWLALGSD